MSRPIPRTCVFKRCPKTDYVPRKSHGNPTRVLGLDLNEWSSVEMVQRFVLERMCYLDSGVQSIEYHLLGDECGMERPFEELFTDAVLHSPERKGKGVMLHLSVEGEESGEVEHLTIELAFHEGEHFDAATNTWGSITPYAWDSGVSSSRIQVHKDMLVAYVPGRFRREILDCASRDQSFTTHYLDDHKSNVMFTSAINVDGVFKSLDDRRADRWTVSELLGGNDGVIVQAVVVMNKVKIGDWVSGMILDAVRPALPNGERLQSELGKVCTFRERAAPAVDREGN